MNETECWAATRLDALRRLRREGYAVVLRPDYERMVKLLADRGVKFGLRRPTEQEAADAAEHNVGLAGSDSAEDDGS